MLGFNRLLAKKVPTSSQTAHNDSRGRLNGVRVNYHWDVREDEKGFSHIFETSKRSGEGKKMGNP